MRRLSESDVPGLSDRDPQERLLGTVHRTGHIPGVQPVPVLGPRQPGDAQHLRRDVRGHAATTVSLGETGDSPERKTS